MMAAPALVVRAAKRCSGSWAACSRKAARFSWNEVSRNLDRRTSAARPGKSQRRALSAERTSLAEGEVSKTSKMTVSSISLFAVLMRAVMKDRLYQLVLLTEYHAEAEELHSVPRYEG
jgi:hypothetical protein